MLTILISAVSYGKNSKSSGPASRQNQENRTSIYTVVAPNSQGSDLLNVTLDETVDVAPDRITFPRARAVSNQGVSMSCNFSFEANEMWSYHFNGNRLIIDRPSGHTLTFVRESGSGSTLNGSWSSKSVENDAQVIRMLSVIGNRLILSQDCES